MATDYMNNPEGFAVVDPYAPICKGQPPAFMVLKVVKKLGPNNGKKFWSCPHGRENGCTSFKWAADSDGESPQSKKPRSSPKTTVKPFGTANPNSTVQVNKENPALLMQVAALSSRLQSLESDIKKTNEDIRITLAKLDNMITFIYTRMSQSDDEDIGDISGAE